MDFKRGNPIYYTEMFYEDFLKEWGAYDTSNIPFFFDGMDIFIFQPRKVAVYQIFIKDYEEVQSELKSIVNEGLGMISNELEMR